MGMEFVFQSHRTMLRVLFMMLMHYIVRSQFHSGGNQMMIKAHHK